MGLNDFILNCEKENEQFKKNIEYYKNKNKRLEEENKQLKEIIDEAIKYMEFISLDKTDKYIAIKDYEEYGILLDILNKYKGDNNE